MKLRFLLRELYAPCHQVLKKEHRSSNTVQKDDSLGCGEYKMPGDLNEEAQ